MTAPLAIAEGLKAVGEGFNTAAQAKAAKAKQHFDEQQAARQYALQKSALGAQQGNQAIGIQNSLNLAPLRDRTMAMIANRMGAPTGSFRPHDLFNQGPSTTGGVLDQGGGAGPTQYGGPNLDALSRQNQAYQPGQGGNNTSVQQSVLNRLGYGSSGAIAPNETPDQRQARLDMEAKRRSMGNPANPGSDPNSGFGFGTGY